MPAREDFNNLTSNIFPFLYYQKDPFRWLVRPALYHFMLQYLLHASGVELASCHWDSDHTGGEGQEQSVARPVQSQRQQLPGQQRVLSTPAEYKHTHTHVNI